MRALPPRQSSFGGSKESGFGRENGVEGLLDYMELKSVVFGGLGA